jgi:hypothetical protein
LSASVQRTLLATGARLALSGKLQAYFDAGDRVHRLISPAVQVTSKNRTGRSHFSLRR